MSYEDDQDEIIAGAQETIFLSNKISHLEAANKALREQVSDIERALDLRSVDRKWIFGMFVNAHARGVDAWGELREEFTNRDRAARQAAESAK